MPASVRWLVVVVCVVGFIAIINVGIVGFGAQETNLAWSSSLMANSPTYFMKATESGIQPHIADTMEALFSRAREEFERDPQNGRIVGCVQIESPHNCVTGWRNALSEHLSTRLCVYSSICVRNLASVRDFGLKMPHMRHILRKLLYLPTTASGGSETVFPSKYGNDTLDEMDRDILRLNSSGRCSSFGNWWGVESIELICPSVGIPPENKTLWSNRPFVLLGGRQTEHLAHATYQTYLPMLSLWDMIGAPPNTTFGVVLEDVDSNTDPLQPDSWPIPAATLQGGSLLILPPNVSHMHTGYPSMSWTHDVCFGPTASGSPPELWGGGIRSSVVAMLRQGMFARIGAAGQEAQDRATWPGRTQAQAQAQAPTLAQSKTNDPEPKSFTPPPNQSSSAFQQIIYDRKHGRKCGDRLLAPKEVKELMGFATWMDGKSWIDIQNDGRVNLPVLNPNGELTPWSSVKHDGPLARGHIFSVVVDATWGLQSSEVYTRVPENLVRLGQSITDKGICQVTQSRSAEKSSWETIQDPLQSLLPKDIQCGSSLRVLFVDRGGGQFGRTLLNAEELLEELLRPATSPFTCPVTLHVRAERGSFGSITAVDQAALVFASDVFLSTHGNEQTSMVYLRPGSVCANIRIPGQGDTGDFYVPAARSAGAHFVDVHCPDGVCQDTHPVWCDNEWKHQNLLLPSKLFRNYLATIVRAGATQSSKTLSRTGLERQNDAWHACFNETRRSQCSGWTCQLVGSYANTPTFHTERYKFDNFANGLPSPTDSGSVITSSTEGLRVFPPIQPKIDCPPKQ